MLEGRAEAPAIERARRAPQHVSRTFAQSRMVREEEGVVRLLPVESVEKDSDVTLPRRVWQERERARAEKWKGWRPEGGRRGLFRSGCEGRVDEIDEWTVRANLHMTEPERFPAPPDLHIAIEEMREEARALGPWRVDGAFRYAPVPVVEWVDGQPDTKINRAFWWERLEEGDADAAIIEEVGAWGVEDGSHSQDIHLAMHHASFFKHGSAGEDAMWGDIEEGLMEVCSEGVPYLPIRLVPRGIVDQVTKLRHISNHSHGEGISTNWGICLDELPVLRLSSGVRYARTVGIFTSAGVRIRVWKRDAKAAYRQVAICSGDLWKCCHAWWEGVAVDLRMSFGTAMSPGKFQRLILVVIREATRRIRDFDSKHPPSDPHLRKWMEDRRAVLGEVGEELLALIQYIDDTLAVSMDDMVEETGEFRADAHMRIYDTCMAEAGIVMADGAKKYDSSESIEGLGVDVRISDWTAGYPAEKNEALQTTLRDLLCQYKVGDTI